MSAREFSKRLSQHFPIELLDRLPSSETEDANRVRHHLHQLESHIVRIQNVLALVDFVKAFAASQAVWYTKTYPQIPTPWRENLTSKDILRLALLTKSLDWVNEHEYRFINYPLDGNAAAGGRVLSSVFKWRSDKLAVLPLRIVVGLTIGAAVTDDHHGYLNELCERRRPAIPVDKAILDDREFKLRFRSA
jgi:hypothetical protein